MSSITAGEAVETKLPHQLNNTLIRGRVCEVSEVYALEGEVVMIEQAILNAVASHLTEIEGSCFPSVERLMALAGIKSKATFHAHKKSLVAKGLLVVVAGSRKADGTQSVNRYSLGSMFAFQPSSADEPGPGSGDELGPGPVDELGAAETPKQAENRASQPGSADEQEEQPSKDLLMEDIYKEQVYEEKGCAREGARGTRPSNSDRSGKVKVTKDMQSEANRRQEERSKAHAASVLASASWAQKGSSEADSGSLVDYASEHGLGIGSEDAQEAPAGRGNRSARDLLLGVS